MILYDAHEIVMKLVGPVRPVGESNEDASRLVNLNHLTQVLDSLLAEVKRCAESSQRPEASMKKIGQAALEYLINLRDDR